MELGKNLGVFLAIGECFKDFKSKGQDDLIIKQNLAWYKKRFEKVYVFSYGNESFSPLKGVVVLPNKYNLHRYIYAILIPIIYRKYILDCHVFRGLQLTGGIPGVIAGLLYKIPVVINYGYRYSEYAKKERKIFQWLLFKSIEPLVIRLATKIIVTTRELKKHLEDTYSFAHKISYIPNGVNINLFKPIRIKKKKNSIVYVGRLEEIKNLKNLIQAISLIPFKVKAEFFGAGSINEELRLLAKEQHVTLTIHTPVPHRKLPQYLNQFSIFILPSVEEGHPKALLEAMSCGLGVIGTRVRGIKSLIYPMKTGVLCETSPRSIAESITYLFEHPQTIRYLGKNARIYIQKNFDLTETFSKEISLLEYLAEV